MENWPAKQRQAGPQPRGAQRSKLAAGSSPRRQTDAGQLQVERRWAARLRAALRHAEEHLRSVALRQLAAAIRSGAAVRSMRAVVAAPAEERGRPVAGRSRDRPRVPALARPAEPPAWPAVPRPPRDRNPGSASRGRSSSCRSAMSPRNEGSQKPPRACRALPGLSEPLTRDAGQTFQPVDRQAQTTRLTRSCVRASNGSRAPRACNRQSLEWLPANCSMRYVANVRRPDF